MSKELRELREAAQQRQAAALEFFNDHPGIFRGRSTQRGQDLARAVDSLSNEPYWKKVGRKQRLTILRSGISATDHLLSMNRAQRRKHLGERGPTWKTR